MNAVNSHHQDKATLLERLIFNNRPIVIILCLLATLFLAFQATQVRPSTSFEKMIPLKHPFIQNMLSHINDLSNLGNTVRISVEAVNGDIFTKEYMDTLRQIHDEVFYIPGIGRYAYNAINLSDLPVIQGTVLFGAFFIVMMSLLVDILYAFIDPRVRY